VSSYYLIVVHEEAVDECAHAQLIVDTILLGCRGTSLIMSSRTTQALPKTESWVAAWIDFCFLSTPSFFLTSEMKTENSLLERIEVGGRRTRTAVLPGSDGIGAFVSTVPVKRFHFITAVRLQRSVDPVGYLVYTTRSLIRSVHAITMS
jgi:hypothetical protein